MTLLRKNFVVAFFGALISYGFWLSRPDWDPEMRFWRAVGDGSLILLVLALALGPLARLSPVFGRWLSYRRELGVWFGLFALLHTLLILNGWARWSALKFLGYEYIPELNRVARLEPGFGLANILGLVAMLLTLVLMATSTDYALRKLGGSAWKFLQLSAYTVFYLVVLHTAYFLFMHYTQSFHRNVPENPNWFRFPFLVITGLVIVLQSVSYLKSLRRQQLKQSNLAESR
jgi:methionine sulfoxide reductase heme-binding subunit